VKATVTIASSAALVAWAVVGLQAGPGETEPPIQAGYAVMAVVAVMAAVFALGQMWRWAALAIAISVIMVPIFLVAQISCCMK